MHAARARVNAITRRAVARLRFPRNEREHLLNSFRKTSARRAVGFREELSKREASVSPSRSETSTQKRRSLLFIFHQEIWTLRLHRRLRRISRGVMKPSRSLTAELFVPVDICNCTSKCWREYGRWHKFAAGNETPRKVSRAQRETSCVFSRKINARRWFTVCPYIGWIIGKNSKVTIEN